MIFQNEREIFDGEILACTDSGTVEVLNDELFVRQKIDALAKTVALSKDQYLRGLCAWIAYEVGRVNGIYPASISGLYDARGRGDISGFTVPAINIRTLTYDKAQAVFRIAKKFNAAAFIFEIAETEIEYTDQSLKEYFSVIMLAAIKEGYRGPVFFQGDHFQIKSKNFIMDKESEIARLKKVIKRAVDICFYNIDIDGSPLVDLSEDGYFQQQRLNSDITSTLAKYVREIQPEGIDICLGGEIGEVGGKNSTIDEFDAFMQGHRQMLDGKKGISKISIQTGTTHGGVVLPDGTLAMIMINFETIKAISEIGRKKYGIAGAVQHGASTLPSEAFGKFAQFDCAEVHLATQFQNLFYDYLPLVMKEEIYEWIKENLRDERRSEWTNHQFIYRVRKKALGKFKPKIHGLSQDIKKRIVEAMESEFTVLFQKLGVENSLPLIERYVTVHNIVKKKEDFLGPDIDC
ncbi:MAG: class II fructose-bisphosphate aldolase [Candidatus Omnitrophica bacterium]|nr:class II fructose-bisphosphate aldolase [Candidatus Omnitrophota bacterium]